MSEINSNRKYFKGFDAMRGIAAIVVVLGHVELVKSAVGYENMASGNGPFFLYSGSLAVSFFFVLSGFLITYLLLIEKRQNGMIILKNFYLRRLLRIWPVYYILFISGFFVLPIVVPYLLVSPTPISSEEYWPSFILNLFLLPNFIKPSNPIAFQYWSIGVEEQFYILCPLLFIYIKSLKKLAVTMSIIVIGIFILRSLIIIPKFINIQSDFCIVVNSFFAENRFDNMAIGGLAGIYFYLKPTFKFNMFIKIAVSAVVFYIIAFTTNVGFGLDNIIAALCFAMLIMLVATTDSISFLENRVFKFIGKISYGLYMYHVVAIIIALNLMKIIVPDFNGQGYLNIVLHVLSVSLTILIAKLSYMYIEKYFLKFKK